MSLVNYIGNEKFKEWTCLEELNEKINGCYVNSSKEIVTEFRISTGMMSENEGDKYFGLLRKTLTGTIGKHLIDICFHTSQVTDGPSINY